MASWLCVLAATQKVVINSRLNMILRYKGDERRLHEMCAHVSDVSNVSDVSDISAAVLPPQHYRFPDHQIFDGFWFRQ